jgi:uncharacterized membrane protein YfcA
MDANTLRFVVIGLIAGVASGFFGIGGGVLVVPMLIYWLGWSQHRATGTSLAVLLPPVGLAAVLAYYRTGNVDVRAAMIIAASMFVGGGVGALGANRVAGPYLRLAFGIFIVILGGYLIFGAARRLGWIA